MNTNVTLKFETFGKIADKKEMRKIIFTMIKTNEFQFVKADATPSRYNSGYFDYTVEVNAEFEY